MIYLIIIFTSLFFILAWRRLDWAVMFLIAALPSYLIRFSIFGLPSTLLEVIIWVVFLVWFIKNFRFIFESFKLKIENRKLKINNRYPFDWEIALMLIIALAAVGAAGFSASSLGIWKAYFFEPALFFIVVLNVMKGWAGRKKILWSLAISALAVSALAIYQKITGQLIDNPLWAAAETRRVVSFFGYPNAVGLYLGPLVLVMVGWLSTVIARRAPFLSSSGELQRDPGIQKDETQINLDSRLSAQAGPRGNDKTEMVARNDNIAVFFISLTIILSLLSIYFAKSKGALMGVAAGLIIFGLLAGKRIRWVMMAALIIAGIVMAIYQPARNLAYQIVTFKTLSGQIRLAGWRDSWNMLSDGRLITGVGLANFQAAVTPYHTEGIFFNKDNDPDFRRKIVLFNDEYKKKFWQPLEIYLYPHNIILNFWSELGLAGLLLFVWVIIKCFWLGIFFLSSRGTFYFCHPRASDSETRGSRKNGNERFWIPSASWRMRGMTRGRGSLAMTNRYLMAGLICAMVVIVAHGMVDAPYFKNDLAVMFWLFVAMMSMINIENKYEKNI